MLAERLNVGPDDAFEVLAGGPLRNRLLSDPAWEVATCSADGA